MEADERPVRGELMRLEAADLRAVGDHQGDAVLSKQRHHLGDEPAVVAELEAVAAGRQLSERLREPRVVPVERRWELPEHGTELGERTSGSIRE
jgi:hypothetical protein